MLTFTEFVKVSKLPIAKIQAFYQKVGDGIAKGINVADVDSLIFNAFPNRKLTATAVSGIVLPSAATMKKGDGKVTILERNYSDVDIRVNVKLVTEDMWYALNWEFVDEYRDAHIKAGATGPSNHHVYFIAKFQAEGVKAVGKTETNVMVKPDFSDANTVVARIRQQEMRHINYHAQETDLKVARVKAKAARAIEKEANRNPATVRQNFMTKATKVEQKVFETLEKEYKQTLENSFYTFAQSIQKKFKELTTNARYPIRYGNGKNTWDIYYAYTEQDVARFEFGAEAWLCFATEKEVKDFAGACALREIATVITEVKQAGGDILDVGAVTIAQNAHLNALFKTVMGRVNVLTFPAALDSIFMRPHLRTRVTLLKH